MYIHKILQCNFTSNFNKFSRNYRELDAKHFDISSNIWYRIKQTRYIEALAVFVLLCPWEFIESFSVSSRVSHQNFIDNHKLVESSRIHREHPHPDSLFIIIMALIEWDSFNHNCMLVMMSLHMLFSLSSTLTTETRRRRVIIYDDWTLNFLNEHQICQIVD